MAMITACRKKESKDLFGMEEKTTSTIMGKTYTTKVDNSYAMVSFSIVSFSIKDLISTDDDLEVNGTTDHYKELPFPEAIHELESYYTRFSHVKSLQIKLQDKVIFERNFGENDPVWTAMRVNNYLSHYPKVDWICYLLQRADII